METPQAQGAAMITGPVIARQLSRVQIEFLLDHVSGERRVSMTKIDIATCEALIKKKLVRFNQSAHVTLRPKATLLTELGRAVIGYILGDWADALTRWGYGYGLDTRDKETMIHEHADRYRPANGNPRDGKFASRRPRGLNERCGVHFVPAPMWVCDGIDHPIQQTSHHDGTNPPEA